MSCCKTSHSVHSPCLCQKRCHGNNCSNRGCRCQRKLIKDCICIEWSVPQANTQTVFQTQGYNNIYVAGFISFDYGSSDWIIVRFFNGNEQVGTSRVFKNSSSAFSLTRFDRITIECAASSVVPLERCEGEISLVTRIPAF